MLISTLARALGMLLTAASPPPDTVIARSTALSADDVLAKSRAAYAALTSYADSGTVADETNHFTTRSTFRVLFTRKPHQLLIDYHAGVSVYKSGARVPLNKRVVLWLDNGDLQTWHSGLQAHETCPAAGGQQVNALKGGAASTAGISVLIPSHLYKTSMVSSVHATEEAAADGYETVNGRRCYRIRGVERWRYPSGRETAIRPITLWIDAETYLIHRIVQDTPRSSPRNVISRRITTIRPHADPTLEPAQFRFAVPES